MTEKPKLATSNIGRVREQGPQTLLSGVEINKIPLKGNLEVCVNISKAYARAYNMPF